MGPAPKPTGANKAGGADGSKNSNHLVPPANGNASNGSANGVDGSQPTNAEVKPANGNSSLDDTTTPEPLKALVDLVNHDNESTSRAGSPTTGKGRGGGKGRGHK